MKPKKKNKVFTLICSFVPGAAEMYTGFMKMGFSLLLLFLFSLAIPALLTANDIFIFLGCAVWFYSFFHARNLDAADELEVADLEDKFIWEEFTDIKPIQISNKSLNKWMGVLAILLGVSSFWNCMRSLVYDLIPDEKWEILYPIVSNIPGMVFSLIVILFGIKLIAGKKAELIDDVQAQPKAIEVVSKDAEENQNKQE